MADQECNKIHISGLNVHLKIGYTAEERAFPQKVAINCQITTATWSQATKEGDLSSTICYDTVSSLITEICLSKPWHLVEELLEEISIQIFKTFGLADKIGIELRKFVVPNTDYTSVEIIRVRP